MTTLPATLPTSLRTEFLCHLCGHRRAVEFHDPEAFKDPEPVAMSGRNRWAQEQAVLTAEARLKKHAEKALALVRCPACGKRDAVAVRRALVPAALPLVGLSPPLFMAGVIATALLLPKVTHGAVWVPVLCGVLLLLFSAPIIVFRRRRKMLDEAATATRFLAELPP